jgi:hypothetical protein
LMGILLKCRLLLVVKAFSQYCVCQSMNIEIFPFSIVFFDFLFKIVCSFPCKGLSLALLSLLVSILFKFVINVVVLCSFLICSLLIHRKTIDFYKFILYPAMLLKVFVMSRRFLMQVSRSFRYIT